MPSKKKIWLYSSKKKKRKEKVMPSQKKFRLYSRKKKRNEKKNVMPSTNTNIILRHSIIILQSKTDLATELHWRKWAVWSYLSSIYCSLRKMWRIWKTEVNTGQVHVIFYSLESYHFDDITSISTHSFSRVLISWQQEKELFHFHFGEFKGNCCTLHKHCMFDFWSGSLALHLILPKYMRPKPPWPTGAPSFQAFFPVSVRTSPGGNSSASFLLAGALPFPAALALGGIWNTSIWR